MNDAHIIETAIEQRFSRVATPDVPRGPWRTTRAAMTPRPRPSRRVAFAGAVAAVALAAGIAQASGALDAGYARLMGYGGSTRPLPPLIHRADRLTVAQAQEHMPFTIVIPSGLPANTTLSYAHVVSEQPAPRVALNYQAVIDGKYYRIMIGETTVANGPAVARLETISKGRDGQMKHVTWSVPVRRWKHGAVVMEMVAPGLPPGVADRIVRESTR